MFGNLNGWHALILVAVILLIFGAPKLPGLARSIGQSLKILKSEVGAKSADAGAETTASADNDEAPVSPSSRPDVRSAS